MKRDGIGRPSTYVSTVSKLVDRKYVENYLSIIKEISNQYETKFFEENGVHTEAYWFDYLRELITEE